MHLSLQDLPALDILHIVETLILADPFKDDRSVDVSIAPMTLALHPSPRRCGPSIPDHVIIAIGSGPVADRSMIGLDIWTKKTSWSHKLLNLTIDYTTAVINISILKELPL